MVNSSEDFSALVVGYRMECNDADLVAAGFPELRKHFYRINGANNFSDEVVGWLIAQTCWNESTKVDLERYQRESKEREAFIERVGDTLKGLGIESELGLWLMG